MYSQASAPSEILSGGQPIRRVETWRQILEKNLAKICHNGLIIGAIFRHFEFELLKSTNKIFYK
jgi:hypothetical protein